MSDKKSIAPMIVVVVLVLVAGLAIGWYAGSTGLHKSSGQAVNAPAGATGRIGDPQEEQIKSAIALAIVAHSDELAAEVYTSMKNGSVENEALSTLQNIAMANRGNRANQRQERTPEDHDRVWDVQVENSYVRGPADAPVTIVAFSEFQCPACAKSFGSIEEILAQYGDKVRFVFKSKILPRHEDAPLAHHAALAAGAQGKFWEYHDRLFSERLGQNRMDALKRENLIKYAQELGLDVARFTTDMDSDKYEGLLEAEHQQGLELEINATPTFFVNGHRYTGLAPDFKDIVGNYIQQAEK